MNVSQFTLRINIGIYSTLHLIYFRNLKLCTISSGKRCTGYIRDKLLIQGIRVQNNVDFFPSIRIHLPNTQFLKTALF